MVNIPFPLVVGAWSILIGMGVMFPMYTSGWGCLGDINKEKVMIFDIPLQIIRNRLLYWWIWTLLSPRA